VAGATVAAGIVGMSTRVHFFFKSRRYRAVLGLVAVLGFAVAPPGAVDATAATTRILTATGRRAVPLPSAVPAGLSVFAIQEHSNAATGGPVMRRRSPASPAGSGVVTITGFGDGPGIGMGQLGALGYAIRYHKSYQWIVRHFYGHTYLTSLSSASDKAMVAVDLSELDNEPSTVVRANRPGSILVINGVRQSRGTHIVAHRGTLETVRASAGDVRVELPGGIWRAYQGEIQVQSDHRTWNIVTLEDYIAGVVPSESIASWGAEGGEAALQAQAIAARSYATVYAATAGAICDWAACQAYNGDPGTYLGSYAAYGDRAASSTAARVMCAANRSPCPVSDVAVTQYCASTGGWTAGGPFPAVVDAGDVVSPYHSWSAPTSVIAVQRAYPEVGRVTGLRVTKRNGHGTWGGRALEIKIFGTASTITDTGIDFAAQLGLDSDWFRFASQP
jgi:stage II sporulation protein D